jgi:hypothetical protein
MCLNLGPKLTTPSVRVLKWWKKPPEFGPNIWKIILDNTKNVVFFTFLSRKFHFFKQNRIDYKNNAYLCIEIKLYSVSQLKRN